MRHGSLVFLAALALAGAVSSCSGGPGETGDTTGMAGPGGGGSAGSDLTVTGTGAASPGCAPCSIDYQSVVDCDGQVVKTCEGGEGCDPQTGQCRDACAVAADNKQSVGCEYFATYMDLTGGLFKACFAAFVANPWNAPAHVAVEWSGMKLLVENFARIPSGQGKSLVLEPYSNDTGIPPGQVAILFLSGESGPANMQPSAPCPIDSAIPTGVLISGESGIGKAFRITSDVPVVAYQMNPYGGGVAATSGASLLLPTSAWDTNYVGLDIQEQSASLGHPSMNIVAAADGTKVDIVPSAAVVGGGGIPAGPANQVLTLALDSGEHAQLSQADLLTGSIIQADKPIGFMAGHSCMYVPSMGAAACDHGEQMIPPVRALGSEYAAVMYRPRGNEPGIWRVMGLIDGTKLEWSKDVGGPQSVDQGKVVEFITGEPFVVKSQDKDHPFLVLGYMSGQTWSDGTFGTGGIGDPDSVLIVPPDQFLRRYVFFADPTFDETNLVVVRTKHKGAFSDVTLDCAGALSGWAALGEYEWTRVDLSKGSQPVNGCGTGPHEIHSDAPFGIWVWGWAPVTSYGYPGGMNARPINSVFIPAEPK
jgi:hypothetical protein